MIILKGKKIKQDKDGDEITLPIVKIDDSDLTPEDMKEYASATIWINRCATIRKLTPDEFMALDGQEYTFKASKPGTRSVVDPREAAKAYLKAQLALGKTIEEIVAEMA